MSWPFELPSRRRRVLLVDDEEALVEVVGKMLTEAGYDVRSTLDATNAITIAREFQHTLPCWE